tara:strand:- start:6872 stop:7621 length:750 start_codon:yes stop_codon:yes gene_type:complete
MKNIEIDKNNIPDHIAIIMDGNGRWANNKNLPRIIGHRSGVKTVKNITELCGSLGVKILTLYTFSSENWNRPKNEVKALMQLLLKTLKKEIQDLINNNVKLTTIGDLSIFPDEIKQEIVENCSLTKNNTGLNLNLALNYGGRQEIIFAIKLLFDSIKSGKIVKNQINESLISSLIYTSNLPDPDLLIRTGGEFRISNFLLWQIAYTEIHITDLYWPEFKNSDLLKAIADFQSRERRFGKISEQLKINHD